MHLLHKMNLTKLASCQVLNSMHPKMTFSGSSKNKRFWASEDMENGKHRPWGNPCWIRWCFGIPQMHRTTAKSKGRFDAWISSTRCLQVRSTWLPRFRLSTMSPLCSFKSMHKQAQHSLERRRRSSVLLARGRALCSSCWRLSSYLLLIFYTVCVVSHFAYLFVRGRSLPEFPRGDNACVNDCVTKRTHVHTGGSPSNLNHFLLLEPLRRQVITIFLWFHEPKSWSW